MSSGLIQNGKISARCAIYNIEERDIRAPNLKGMGAMERERYSAPYKNKHCFLKLSPSLICKAEKQSSRKTIFIKKYLKFDRLFRLNLWNVWRP